VDFTQLPNEVAVRAPLELWDLAAPAGTTTGELELLLDELELAAPEPGRALLAALRRNPASELAGQLARQALGRLYQDDRLRPCVEEAVRRAAEPHMDLLPAITPAVLVILVLGTIEVEKTPDGGFRLKLRADDLIRAFADYARALPEGVVRAVVDALKPDRQGQHGPPAGGGRG